MQTQAEPIGATVDGVRDALTWPFEPGEIFGTKLRALLQRRKNRDLFDLHQGLEQFALDPDNLIACFEHYLGKGPTIPS